MLTRRLAIRLVLLAVPVFLQPRGIRADTITTLGTRGGEGSGPFTGLNQEPEANLFTGASETAIVVEVPPGRGQVTPRLTLQYSSMGGDSPFGFGWDLLVGRIERNGKWGPPRCSGPHTDDFVLILPNGAVELLPESSGSDYYRARIEEAYVRAQKFPSANANYWVVRDRAGIKYTFGDTDTARVGNSDPLVFMNETPCRLTTSWMLTKVEDPNGNTMDVTWDKIANVPYPQLIQYGANPQAGLAAHFYKVRFGPVPRPVTDQPRNYRSGAETVLSHRIDHIDVETTQYTPTVIRRYILTYRDQEGGPSPPPPDGRQVLLSRVAVKGTADGVNFDVTLQPERHFIYTPSIGGFSTTATPVTPPNTGSGTPLDHLRIVNSSQQVRQTLMDMNGDGLVDILRSGFGAPWQEWHVNFGWVQPESIDPATGVVTPASFGFDTTDTIWTLPVSAEYLRTSLCNEGAWSCAATDTFDLTGDGIPDYVVAANLLANPNYPNWTVYRGEYDTATDTWRFGAAEQWPSPANAQGNSYFIRRAEGTIVYNDVVDMNGDGRVDLVVGEEPPGSPPWNWNVYFNNGAGFDSTPFLFPSPLPVVVDGTVEGGEYSMLTDFNGDGLPDLVYNPLIYDPLTDSFGTDPRCTTTPPDPGALWVDCLEIYYNTGLGFTAVPQLVAVPAFWYVVRANTLDLVDINGDGLPDWVGSYPGNPDLGIPDRWRVLLNLGGVLEPLAPDGSQDPVPSRIWPGGGGQLRRTDDRDLVDVNGDGMLDRLDVPGGATWQVHLNTHVERPNLLSMIENGVGGTNTIAYAPSTVYDNTGALNDEQADLPFVTWVVQAMRFSDGLCTPSPSANVFTAGPAPNLNHCIDEGHDRVTKLIYEDGRFDPDEREFRGFRRVVQRSVEGYQQYDNDTETIFGQDTPTRGRVLTIRTFAGSTSEQRQVRAELNMWGARNAGAGRTQVWRALHQVRTIDVDAATHLVTQEVAVEVDGYGNVTHSYKSGVELGTDLVDTYTTFATPLSGYFIFDRPANVRVYDQSGSRLLEEKWFFYDGLGSGVSKGNVDTVRSRLVAGSGAVVEIHNEYDNFGNIWRSLDGNQNPTTTTFDALYMYPQIVRDALEFATLIETDYRFGHKKKETDPNGAVTEYRYDRAGRLACVLRPFDYETGTCSETHEYQFASAPGQLSVVHSTVRQDDPKPALERWEYFDALGRPRGTDSWRVLDGSSERVKVRTNVARYDAAGRPVELYHPYLESAPAPNNGSTRLDYHLNGTAYLDPLGRVYQTTHSDDQVRRTLYAGALTATIDEEGYKRESDRDFLGRVVEERVYKKDNGADVLDSTMRYEFDGVGRLLEQVQNGVVLKQVTYDLMGRKIQMTDQNSGTWNYEYDAAGNLIVEDDPKSTQHVQLCYNAVNQPLLRCPLAGDFTTRIPCSAPTPTCGAPDEVRYTYYQASVSNSRGRPTRVDDASGTNEIEAYDKRGRVLGSTRTIRLAVNNSSGHASFLYQYDTNDRVTQVTYPDGEIVITEYDPVGQPMVLRNSAQVYITSASYDIFGRVTEIVRTNNTKDYRTYSAANDRHRLWGLGTLQTDTPQGDVHLSLLYQAYTPRGLLQQITDFRNFGTDPNDPNNVVTNTMGYTYDHVGRLLTGVAPPGLGLDRTYGYDPMGRIRQYGSQYFDYSATRPHQLSYVHQGSPTASGFAVDHDDNGNRWHKDAHTYAYDAQDHLKEVTTGGTTTVRLIHDHEGQLCLRYLIENGQTEPYQVTRHYSELAETTDGTLTKWYFLGGQRLVSKQTTNVAWETASLLLPNVFVAVAPISRPALHLQLTGNAPVYAGAGVVLLAVGLAFAPWRRRPVAGFAVRHGHAVAGTLLWIVATLPWPLIIAPSSASAGGGGGGPTPRHYHYDHLGSLQVITDSTGEIAEQIRYSPYGEVRGRWTSQGAPIMYPSPTGRYEFTGYGSDLTSGLQYAGARFYDPSLGSFLTHDPVPGFPNPYLYTRGDPVNLVDPTGAVDPIVVAIIIGFIVGFAASSIRAAAAGASAGDALKAGAIGGGIGAVSGAVLGYVGGALEGTQFAQAYEAMLPALGLYMSVRSDPAGGILTGIGSVVLAYGLYSLLSPAQGATTGSAGEVAVGKGGPRGDYVPPDSSMSYEVNQSGPSELYDPLAGEGRLTGMFLERRQTHFHKGIDLAAPKGTAVFAADAGVVTHTGYGYQGYGQYIDLENPVFGLRFRYAHLSRIARGLNPGISVEAGQLVGFVGDTGAPGAFHLHFEVTLGSRPTDPLNFLPGRRP